MKDYKNPFYWLGIVISIMLALVIVKYEKWFDGHQFLFALLILFMILGFPFLMYYFTVALGHPSPGVIFGAFMTWLGVGGAFEFHKIAMKSGGYKESIRMIFNQPKKESNYLSRGMARKNIISLVPPTYIPDGYIKVSSKKQERGNHPELIYKNKDNGYLIWITASNERLIQFNHLAEVQISYKDIKGITVTIAEEIKKPLVKRKKNEEPSFIEINWDREEIHYNIRCDGLTLAEIEKVILSMPQLSPKS